MLFFGGCAKNPEYLGAVPTDPLDGQPLRYSKEKRCLWSIGWDLVDDGPPVHTHAGDCGFGWCVRGPRVLQLPFRREDSGALTPPHPGESEESPTMDYRKRNE